MMDAPPTLVSARLSDPSPSLLLTLLPNFPSSPTSSTHFYLLPPTAVKRPLLLPLHSDARVSLAKSPIPPPACQLLRPVTSSEGTSVIPRTNSSSENPGVTGLKRRRMRRSNYLGETLVEVQDQVDPPLEKSMRMMVNGGKAFPLLMGGRIENSSYHTRSL